MSDDDQPTNRKVTAAHPFRCLYPCIGVAPVRITRLGKAHLYPCIPFRVERLSRADKKIAVELPLLGQSNENFLNEPIWALQLWVKLNSEPISKNDTGPWQDEQFFMACPFTAEAINVWYQLHGQKKNHHHRRSRYFRFCNCRTLASNFNKSDIGKSKEQASFVKLPPRQRGRAVWAARKKNHFNKTWSLGRRLKAPSVAV